MIRTVFIVFLGGGIGSLARFGVSQGVKQFSESTFPIATLISNVLACVIMGLTLGMFSQKIGEGDLKYFVIAGICGGFSTFSTFSLETLELFRKGQTGFAILNVIVSIILCLLVLYFLVRKTS